MTDLFSIYLNALDWVYRAGDTIRAGMAEITVAEKSDSRDLVTNMDTAIEAFLTQAIAQRYPHDRILGEESQSGAHSAPFQDLNGNVWIIDPIDGTANFVHQRRNFGIMLAYYRDGIGQFGIVYDVMAQHCYSGVLGQGAFVNGRRQALPQDKPLNQSLFLIESGLIRQRDPLTFAIVEAANVVRIVGASAIVTARMAQNEAAGFLTRKQMPWDIAAPAVILRELGYHLSRPDGSIPDPLAPEPYLIAQPKLHAEIIALRKTFHSDSEG